MQAIRAVFFVVACSAGCLAAKPPIIDVWPDKAPGETGEIGPERTLPARKGEKRPVTRITDVTRPTLTVYQPPQEKRTGAAVVICPGGGYHILAWDLEGTEVAQWLNSLGVTAAVLKYRVPRRKSDARGQPPKAALQDVQRAIGLLRHNAKQHGVDPRRIGVLGFSAGGNLAARAATNYRQRTYESIDAADAVSCRPDFAVLIYPAYLVPKGADRLAEEIRVTKDTPPVFFAHAGDDRVSPENSVRMYLALKRAGVPAELHVYASGGHGFGLRPSDKAVSTWPARCAAWLESSGWLRARK